MIRRVVEIGSDCQLSVSNCQLMIRRNEEVVGKVPLEDLGVLVLDNAMITYTLQLLQQCAENRVAVVVCNDKHLPQSLLQPLAGHSLHSRTLARQIEASEPKKKRLWQQIVVSKIKAQALTLERAGADGGRVRSLTWRVKSGDTDNQESQAAAIYWPMLFGEGFRRNPDAEGINTLLNYGYAVVRAAVARSVVGTGLHPSLGLHHHNQYDALCLADDLMEPFRPAVDFLVWRMCLSPGSATNAGRTLELDKETRRNLLGIFETTWLYGGKNQPFMVAVQLYAAAIKAALVEDKSRVEIPMSVEQDGS